MNALNVLVTDWKAFDIKMNREAACGYTPALGVIANRLAGHYETVLRTMAETVRVDAWMEQAYECKGRTFHVGFRDNRDATTYNALCQELAKRAKAIGFKARISKDGSLYITLPASIEADAAEAYPAYLRQLGVKPTLTVVR